VTTKTERREWGRLAEGLDLSAVGWGHDGAIDDFISGDGAQFAHSAYSTHGMLSLVWANLKLLKQRGIYEPAIVEAYIGCKFNNHNWPIQAIECLFRIGDRGKLLACGETLPGEESFTVYRGIAGERHKRKVRGLSWTSSLDAACWFALRLHLPDPAVYLAQLLPADIYCCTNERNELEFIGRPRSCRRLPLSADEMRTHEAQYGAEKQARFKARVDAAMAKNQKQ